MSEIKVDTLTGKTSAGDITVTSEGGAATMQLQQGLAKAWVNFNSLSTLSITDSLNTSSVTDRGVGEHTHNFASSWSLVGYSMGGCGTSTYNYIFALDTSSVTPTTSYAGIETRSGGFSSADTNFGMFSYFGDLA